MRLESKLIEPRSTLMVLSMLSMIMVSMITMVVFFMSSMTVVHRYENGKATAGYEQQDPDYH